MAPNLGWRDVPLGERLAQVLGAAVPIAVANDADLGALAELRRGAARGADDVLSSSGEVGVGGGLIVDGRPLTGVAGYGGEVGHMPVNPDGRPCRCGSIGCWETEVGEGALLRRAGHPPEGGRAAVDAVLREAERGSPVALAALAETGRWLGIGLAGLVNVLNPRLVVLGGRLRRSTRSSLGARGGARPACAAAPRRRSSGSSRPRSGSTRRCSAPPSSRSSRCSPIPAAWLRPRAALADWRAPERRRDAKGRSRPHRAVAGAPDGAAEPESSRVIA